MEAIALMSIQRGRDSRGQPIFINPDDYLVAEGEELAHLLANNAVRQATPDEIILAAAKGKRPPAPQPVVPVETQYAPADTVTEPVTTPETTVETSTPTAPEVAKLEESEVKETKGDEPKASKPAKASKSNKAAKTASGDEDDLEI